MINPDLTPNTLWKRERKGGGVGGVSVSGDPDRTEGTRTKHETRKGGKPRERGTLGDT